MLFSPPYPDHLVSLPALKGKEEEVGEKEETKGGRKKGKKER